MKLSSWLGKIGFLGIAIGAVSLGVMQLASSGAEQRTASLQRQAAMAQLKSMGAEVEAAPNVVVQIQTELGETHGAFFVYRIVSVTGKPVFKVYHPDDDDRPRDSQAPAKLRKYWIETACHYVPQSDAQRYAADGGYQLAVSERQCLRGGDELFSGWPTQGVLVSIVEQVDRVVQITVTPLRKRATSAPVAFSDQPYDAAADGGAVWQQRCQSANKEALPFGLGTQWGGCYGSMTLSEVADAMLGRGFDFS